MEASKVLFYVGIIKSGNVSIMPDFRAEKRIMGGAGAAGEHDSCGGGLSAPSL